MADTLVSEASVRNGREGSNPSFRTKYNDKGDIVVERTNLTLVCAGTLKPAQLVRWQSGRLRRFAKPVSPSGLRGFESHPYRQMGLFSKQTVYCQGCGKEFETTFSSYGGKVCGRECHELVEWKKTLSILGKEYYPDPRKEDQDKD